MSADLQLARPDTDFTPRGEPANAHGPQPPPAPNILHVIHRGLRGRYLLAIALGLLTGSLAAAVAWRYVRPTYRSEGLVRIAYSLPEVVAETDQNRPLLMFDTFMQSQKLLMTSRRMIDQAITDPIWKAMKLSVPPDPDKYFAQHLTVEVKPKSEYIQVSVADTDAATAAAAVTAVINAYVELYNTQEKTLERQRLGVLEDRQAALQAEVEKITNQLKAAEKEYGTQQLDPFYDAAVARVTKLQAALDDIRAAIATAPAMADSASKPLADSDLSSPPAAAQQKPSPEETDEQISLTDATMAGLLNEQTRAERELRQLSLRFGESHPQVLAAKQTLEDARAQVERRRRIYRQYHAVTAQNLNAPRTGPVATAGKTADELRADEAKLQRLFDDANKEMIALGLRRLDMSRLVDRLNSVRAELAQLTKRSEVLHAEGQLGGRLSVISTGEVALSPERDRRLQFAGAAGLTGGCLPAGLLVLLSFLRRRYHYSDDTEADVSPQKNALLGVLPELDGGDPNPQTGAVAHSVHQIRVSLSSQRVNGGPSTYLVTSATSGEGKTTLTMSLGLSFAASGVRTLVVDADLVGRQLSRTLDAVELEGLTEALDRGTIRRHIRKSDLGLYVLTAGRGRPDYACALSHSAIKGLLNETRSYFDVVLIDSGPILGSIEASVLAQEVDSIIFTISRGQERRTVNRAMKKLRSLGANVAGCIFNRARPEDFGSSGSSSSGLSSYAPITTKPSNERLQLFSRFGAVVQAVAAGIPPTQN